MLSLFSSEPRLKTRNRTGYYSLLTAAQTNKSSRLKSLKLFRKGYTLESILQLRTIRLTSLNLFFIKNSKYKRAQHTFIPEDPMPVQDNSPVTYQDRSFLIQNAYIPRHLVEPLARAEA